MLTSWRSAWQQHIWLLEGLILAGSLPFLLFPNRFVPGTLLALLGLIFIETVPVLFRWRPVQTPSALDVPLLLFALILGISILVTADPDLTLDKAAGVLLGLFLWRYLNRTVQAAKQWTIALFVFGVLGLGFVSLGILNASWLNKIALLAPIISRLPNQIVALPGQPGDGIHPNQTAGTLLFYFPLLWSVLLGSRWKVGWARWLWLGLALLGTAVLFLTQSRSGWLGGAAAVYVLVALWALSQHSGSPAQRRLLLLLGALTLAGLAGLAVIGPERLVELWQDPAQETAVGSFGSLGFRQEVWRWTIVAVQDFPFTGIGLGSFRRVIRRLYPLGVDPGYEVVHAHNLYLHTAVDIGIPGLIVYLAIIGLVLGLGWQAARHNTHVRPYALGLTAGLLAYHVYGIGDALAFGSKTGLAFWFLLGLITTLHQVSNATVEAEPEVSLPGVNAPGQLANQR
ncbi:MAG: O-antigen ligase family protein [Anaerolineaceae bacterium]|nr:O-antigen ligase family protein [Anaerolineaceae bacterium]